MLRIAAPSVTPELAWIVSVLIGEFIGVEYRLDTGEEGLFEIALGPASIVMPDCFFGAAQALWLHPDSLPGTSRTMLDLGALGDEAGVVPNKIPVIYGEAAQGITQDGQSIRVPIDIFGSAFVMLSRYEEAIVPERDAHGRFPGRASIAWRYGFRDRPIIDEYVAILAACIGRLWPGIAVRRPQPRTVVSCDVDHPYHSGARSLSRAFRRSAGELLRKGSLSDALRPMRNYIASRAGDWTHDPYYHTVDWMMDVNERAGNTVAFNFIPEVTDPVYDGICTITDSAVRAMLRRIAGRGHEVGIHPGYRACSEDTNIAFLRRRLECVLDQEGVPRRVSGGRQHYLRWSTRIPPRWDAAGLVYDSTLGYAESGGFRCGTCREYPMYDLHARRPLRTRQRPLVCMEAAMFDATRVGPSDAAFDAMRSLKQAARRVGGDFTLLWHNSSLDTPREREMYCHLIE